ncbi:SCO3242 family prenyltransferase [Actinophytocola algeriensis]|uniref:4-hydroxybenzoate polyprenyltransferase n=1 Tax=Actinophytocola algeriensis TaxID=1768010 RepID=A0A7W7PYS2_9PSEU|nr:UbiA family prenyltransferase [Actinophytocola algeriensis]MBB4903805.1 4-hydroxybenzoate polyprenyltransferase [Actinophytocola algeriensis]MBE1477338.1 4-hydroxybenzoate polyprenyltransferase [Actinophytocola algeriensis]
MKAFLQLVRAPAALTVIGDTVAGAAAAGRPLRGRRLLLPLSSASFYWAGMALNDWADRKLDAVERPERPIPSGRVSPDQALAVAGGLTAAGLGLARAAGGRDTLKIAVPLAAAVWAYDTVLKKTAAGPAGMAACRALDVLMGAGAGNVRKALPSAMAVGGHTYGVTALSRGEVHGASPRTARAAFAGTVATAATSIIGARTWRDRLAALAFSGAYSGLVGRAQYDAAQDPSAQKVRSATMAGIHGMVPLQAALAARRGSLLGAVAVAAALPVAKRLAKKVSPT